MTKTILRNAGIALLLCVAGCTSMQERNTVIGGTAGAGFGAIAAGPGGAVAGALIGGGTGYIVTDQPRRHTVPTSYQRTEE